MKLTPVLIAVFLFLNQIGISQTAPSIKFEETGIWEGVYLNVRINDRFGYYAEHHWRGGNTADNVTSWIGRPKKIYNRMGLNFFATDNFEVVVGPALIVNFSPDPGNPKYKSATVEPRIWSQFLFKSPYVGRVKFVSQFRFEQRWKKKNDIGADFEFTWRWRYKFFAYVPLNKKHLEIGTLYFSPSVEIFMQSGKPVVYNPMEDFRTYNGIGYVLNSNITFFAGHMWTLGQKSTGYEYKTTHIIRLNVYIGLDGRSSTDKMPKINLGY